MRRTSVPGTEIPVRHLVSIQQISSAGESLESSQTARRIRTPYGSRDEGICEEAFPGETIMTTDSCIALGMERVEQGADDQGVRPD